MSLQTYALTTVQDVADYLGVATHPQPQIIERMINAVSLQVIMYAGREFKPLTTATTRTFAVSPSGQVVFAPHEPRLLTTVVANTESTAPTTLAATDYQAGVWDDSGAYKSLRLLSGYTRPRSGVTGMVSVTSATWGWTSIPPDVELACIRQVAEWVRRDLQAQSDIIGDDSTGGAAPTLYRLSAGVTSLLGSYRVPVVA
jgi:hypothetical protein